MKNFGIVVIGRNEGNRLVHCLKTLKLQIQHDVPVVYVDSGSSDKSVEAAQNLGVHVIELDSSIPFTMARGRNTGFNYLTQHYQLEYVQFIDGDCELVKGWLEKALKTFQNGDDSLAVVCGRRRERFPEESIFNQLADIEWNKPPGEVKACGGDSMVRVKAIQDVGGFNDSLICGEEPEMCIRLRRQGWKIFRINAEMTLHDAAMTSFGQWWQRSVRAGWAGAQGMAMYGGAPEHYKVRECIACCLGGPVLLTLGIALSSFTSGYSFLVYFIYVVQVARAYQKKMLQNNSLREAFLSAIFSLLIKFPHAVGQLRFWINYLRGGEARLIEYKSEVVAS